MKPKQPEQLDGYALTHLPAHIYAAGPQHAPTLYKLVSSRLWFTAQEDFDLTRRSYAESLSWGLRAYGELSLAKQPDGLTQLAVLGLLHATVASLASSVPPTAIEALSRVGEQRAAAAFVEMQQDEFERCLSVCRMAEISHKSGDTARTRELLSQAHQRALDIHAVRTQAQALACVAQAAGRAGQAELQVRSTRRVVELVRDQNWPAISLAREFKLMDRPEYLLSLIDWDREQGHLDPMALGRAMLSGLPALAKCAADRRDKALIAALLPKVSVSEIEDVVEALVEGGAIEEAFQFMDQCAQKDWYSRGLPEKAARGAGRRGDLDTIMRAARYKPPPALQEHPPTGPYDSWGDRLKDTMGQGLMTAGGRLLGQHPDVISVYLEGLSGLEESHPEQAKCLVQLVEKDMTGLGRLLSHEAKAYAGQLGGALTETAAHPATSGVLGGLLAAGVWAAKKGLPEAEDVSEAISVQMVWKAMQGDLDGAARLLDDVKDSAKRDETISILVDLCLKRGQPERGLQLAGDMQNAKERRAALERVAASIAKLPLAQAEPLLKRVCRVASRLPQELALSSAGLIPSVARALAEKGLLDEALGLLPGVAENTRALALASLGAWAAEKGDRELAEKILQKLEAADPGSRRERNLPVSAYTEGAGITAPIKHLAGLSMAFSKAGRRATSMATQVWHSLALRAYNLAESSTLSQAPHTWLWLARAADELGDRSVLLNLAKRIEKSPAFAYVEHARAYVVVGLTRLGEYVDMGGEMAPALVSSMQTKHNQALALAEMSVIVRELPPQKRGLFKTVSREDMELRSNALMERSLEVLQLADRYFSQVSNLSFPKPAASRPNSLSGNLFARRSQLPAQSLMGAYLPQALRLIEIYCQAGLFSAAERLTGDVTQQSDREEAWSHLIRCLLESGQTQRAQSCIKELKSNRASWLGWLAIAESSVRNNPANAVQALFEYLLPALWSDPKYLEALPRVALVISALPNSDRPRALQILLDQAARQDRRNLLAVLSALLPSLASVISQAALQGMIHKITETERWWQPAPSSKGA